MLGLGCRHACGDNSGTDKGALGADHDICRGLGNSGKKAETFSFSFFFCVCVVEKGLSLEAKSLLVYISSRNRYFEKTVGHDTTAS